MRERCENRKMKNIKITTKKALTLSERSYIYIKLGNKKFKEYTGQKLGIDIRPNSCRTIIERDEQLSLLEYEFRKAIDFGKYPISKNSPLIIEKSKTLSELLDQAIENKTKANLSKMYLANLRSLKINFQTFLTEEELASDINHLKRYRIQEFLNQFNSSGTYYMHTRRHLRAIFSEIDKDYEFNTSIITRTDRRKSIPILHKIYTEDQIHKVLDFIKVLHPDLYLCCLMSYGCLLRPHNEIRILKRSHFKNDFSEIHLSGTENKGGKIRIVPIPNYVRQILLPKIENLNPDDNIFSRNSIPRNRCYFGTAWTRIFNQMKKSKIVESNQTIYSFRHSAAVNVFKKTKDLHIVQQLMGHSDMIVTLKYLRGLGVHNTDELRDVLPDL